MIDLVNHMENCHNTIRMTDVKEFPYFDHDGLGKVRENLLSQREIKELKF